MSKFDQNTTLSVNVVICKCQVDYDFFLNINAREIKINNSTQPKLEFNIKEEIGRKRKEKRGVGRSGVGRENNVIWLLKLV